MLEKLKQKKKFIVVLLLITIAIIIAGIAISKLKDTSLGENNEEQDKANLVDSINYTTSINGAKENNSIRVKEEQRVKYLVISNTKIVYENNISKLTAEILNTSRDSSNLKFKAIFLGNDSKTIVEKEFVIGDIKANEIKNINIELQKDIANTNLIRYEIIN